MHSPEEHGIARVAWQENQEAYLESGKGAQHVKGVHELLVLRLAALTCPGSCTLALLPLALLLQPSIRILNICSKQRKSLPHQHFYALVGSYAVSTKIRSWSSLHRN